MALLFMGCIDVSGLEGKLRFALLNGESFTTLLEAKVLIEKWRNEYNHFRPHSALNYQPSAPITIKLKMEILTKKMVQLTRAGQRGVVLLGQIFNGRD